MKKLCEQTNSILSLKRGISKRPVQKIWLNPKPKDTAEYSSIFDATFDRAKDIWLEEKCTDECGCEFCSNRPDKPSQAKEL
jgi:hypothetical protein